MRSQSKSLALNHKQTWPENVQFAAHSGLTRAVDPPRHLGAFCVGFALNFHIRKISLSPVIDRV